MLDLIELKLKANFVEIENATEALKKLKQESVEIEKQQTQSGKQNKKLSDSNEELADKLTAVERALVKAETKMKVLRGETIALADGNVQLGKGFTGSQAAQLASLKVQGAMVDQLKEMGSYFRDLNALSGVNPFDKIADGISKMQGEVKELSVLNELQSRGLGLTIDQYKILGRDINALTQVHRELASSQETINKAVDEHIIKFTQVADVLNRETAAAESASKAVKELAAAEAARSKDAANMGPSKQDFYKYLERQASEAEKEKRRQQELTAVHEKNLAEQKIRREKEIAQQVIEYEKNIALQKEAIEKSRQKSSDDLFTIQMARLKEEQKAVEERSKMWKQMYGEDQKAYDLAEKLALKASGATGRRSVEKPEIFGPPIALFEKQQRAAAKATEYLSQAEQRLKVALDETNSGLHERYTDRLNKYQQALKASGLSADVASAKFDNFRQSLNQLQTKEQADQIQYLARAMSVQMGDVAVSLASGMNPLMVMIQQGDQIRAAIAQAGVEGVALSSSMKSAAGIIAMSFIDTGKAIGGFFTGSIMAAGNAVLDFSKKYVGLGYIANMLSRQFASVGEAGFTMIGKMQKFSAVFAAIFGTAAVGVVATLAAFSVALYQVTKQEDALAKQLALTGGSLGMTQGSAIDYAKSMNEVGISTSDAINVIAEMAKQGGFAKSEIQMITKSATEMSKYFDVSIEDTVKAFAKLKEEPSKALIEIGKATGMVSEETLKLVGDLEEQGKKSEAAGIAMKAYADVQTEQVKRVKEEYSNLSLSLIELGDKISNFWNDTIKGLFYKASPIAVMQEQIKSLDEAIANKKMFGGLYSESIKQMEDERKVLVDQLNAQTRLADEKERQTLANAKAAKQQEYNDKIHTEAMSDIEKKQLRIKQIQSQMDDSNRVDSLKLIAKLEEKISKIKKRDLRGSDEYKEQQKLDKYYQSSLERAKDLLNKQTGATIELTQAEILLKDLRDDESWKKLSSNQRQQIEDTLKQASAEQKYREEIEAATKAREIQYEYLDKLNKINLENQGNLDKETIALEQRIALIGKTEEEQTLLKIQYEEQAKLQAIALKYDEQRAELARQYKDQIKNISSIQNLSDAERLNQVQEIISAYNKAFYDAAGKESQERLLAQKATNVAIAEDQYKKFKEIQDNIADIIATAMFEGGAAGSKKLKDYLKTSFRKFVIDVFINPVVGGAMSSIASAIGLANASSSVSGMSTSGLVSAAKTGGDLYSAATGSFAKAGTYAELAFDKIVNTKLGEKLGLSTYTPIKEINTVTGEATNLAGGYTPTAETAKLSSSIGSIATSMAASLVGQALRKAIAGGFKMNSGLEKVADIAGIAAGFDPTGFSQIVVGVVSGLASRAFGTKLTQAGISGVFGGESGFTGNRYTFEKGGWFRSDKTKLKPLEEELRNTLALSFAVTKAEVQKFSEYLGIGAEVIAGFTKKVKINLLGLSESEAVKKVQEVFDSVKNAMAAAVLAGKNYTKEGENQYQTLERLANTVYTVNSMFKDLGVSLLDTGFAGVDAALAYSEYFGGLDNLSSALGKFYENFYSDAEKTSNLSRNLTDAFSSLGLQMPKTREEFKNLVLSVFKLGDPGLLSKVLSLQDRFISLTETALNSFKELTSGIQEEIDRLRADNVQSSDNIGTTLRTEFDILSSLARSGNVDALAKLPEYSQAIEKNMTDFASSASDVIFARALLAQSLSDTMSVLNGNTSIAPTSVSSTSAISPAITASNATVASTATSQSDLLSMLITEIQGLRAEVRADVSANSKTSRILERANQDGETISVTVA